MEQVKIVEVSSGFANIPNKIILAQHYTKAAEERPGSAYDERYTIELPDGFEIAETYGAGEAIFHGNEHITLVSINHAKKHVTGVGDDYYRFPIIKEGW